MADKSLLLSIQREGADVVVALAVDGLGSGNEVIFRRTCEDAMAAELLMLKLAGDRACRVEAFAATQYGYGYTDGRARHPRETVFPTLI